MYKMFALTVIALVALTVGFPGTAVAQLRTAQLGPVVYGHHHINATNPADHQRFWVDTLGGRPVALGGGDGIAFPNVILLITPMKPAGGTKGSSVDHLGFQVQNLSAILDKVRKGGYQIVTNAELTATASAELAPLSTSAELTTLSADAGLTTLSADAGATLSGGTELTTLSAGDPTLSAKAGPTQVAYVTGPDNVTVELVEVPGSSDPIGLHHIHFFTPEAAAMQAWYAKVFDTSNVSGVIESATLPGVGLMFSPSERPVAGTKGRALDHIGLEVKELAKFTKKLESMGVKLDLPFTKVERAKLAVAFLTDPWGTRIELTEGMTAVK